MSVIGQDAFGIPEQIAARLQAYFDAGADAVAVVPVTAEDPAGRAVLECAAEYAAAIGGLVSSKQETR